MVSEGDWVHFIDDKMNFCASIYSLLKSICKHNRENEEYLYKLIPRFQHHLLVFPPAIDCIIEIIRHNETLLNRVSENIQFDNLFNDDYAAIMDNINNTYQAGGQHSSKRL